MQTLILTLRLRTNPECPICRITLVAQSITFITNIAYCSACHLPLSWRTHEVIARIVRTGIFARHWSTVYGLHFFTPHVECPRNIGVHLLLKGEFLKNDDEPPPDSESTSG